MAALNFKTIKLLGKDALGKQTLKNRMAMAPMTRSPADWSGVVNDLTVLYCRKERSGLTISENINISEQALGNPFTPGIYTREQIEACWLTYIRWTPFSLWTNCLITQRIH